MKNAKMSTILVLVVSVAVLVCLGQEASGGTLAGWGYNNYGQCDVPAGKDFAAIAAGGYHSLALQADGSVSAWGANGNGQCDVPAGNDFVDVAAGGNHSLALKSDGSLAAWGYNANGQCDVPAGNDFAAVAAGGVHSLALKLDGSLAAWGNNVFGQCNVPAGNDFAAIAAGFMHSLALKSDGSLAAWGWNDYGQCDVPAGNDFVAIAGGDYHSLALKSDGSLAAWGYNSHGQCDVPAGNDFVDVAAGGYHSLALKSDGSLAAWGQNTSGQCDVPAGNDFVAIAAGGSYSLAITMAAQPMPMGTAFTYQGRLMDKGTPAEGLYDLQFKLYDNPDPFASQQGNTIDINDLDVIDGQFAIELDFGSDVFEGMARWLETAVRPGDSNDVNDFVTFSPRQELTPTPYALYAKTTGGVPGGISGSGTSNYIAKFTGSDTIGDSAIYEEAGNVGIGTIYPTEKLEVNGNAKVTGDLTVDGRYYDSSSSAGVGAQFLSSNGTGTMWDNVNWDNLKDIPLGFADGIDNVGGGDSDWIISGDDMYSGVSGKVGIGTTSPGEKLEVAGTVRSHGLSTRTVLAGQSHDATGPGLKVSRSLAPPAHGQTWMEIDDTSIDTYWRSAITIGTTLKLNSNSSGGVILAEGGGNVGIGTDTPAEKLTVRGGNILIERADGTDVVEIGEGLDYAEGFDVSDKSEIAGGTVLVIDCKNPGKLAISDKPYDSKVAGIVAGAKGQGSGVRLGSDEFDYDVALAGRVYCNVDGTEAGVEPGDLLTTSATPGYAMKAADYIRAQGAILGKAMESLEKGNKGQILVLVTLQ